LKSLFCCAIIKLLRERAKPGKPGGAKLWVYGFSKLETRTARLPKIAKPSKDGGTEFGI
jgi:hypothetical protein